jgi:hypothetical protein
MDKDRNGGKYNGWNTYETWAVKLWLDNEEGSYRYWTEQAREWQGSQRATLCLAEQL